MMLLLLDENINLSMILMECEVELKFQQVIGVQREFQNHAVTLSPQGQEALDKYLIRIPPL